MRPSTYKRTGRETVLILLRGLGIFLFSTLSARRVASSDTKGLWFFLIYVAIPPLYYILLEEYHQEKKERVTVQYRERPRLFSTLLSLPFSRDFWEAVAPFLILSALFPPTSFAKLFFLPKVLPFLLREILARALYLILQILFLAVAEFFLRVDWFRLWKASAYKMKGDLADIPPLPITRLFLNLLIVFGGFVVIVGVIPFLVLILMIAVKLIFMSDTMTFLFFLLLFGLPAFRWLRVIGQKRKFKKTMKKICHERSYRFHWHAKCYRGGYLASLREEFEVETPDTLYSGTFLPVHSWRSFLYFLEDDAFQFTHRYQFEKRFFWWWIVYPKHRIFFTPTPHPLSKKPVTKVVVLTRVSDRIRRGDRDTSFPLYPGDRIGELTVHHAESFCNHIDRLVFSKNQKQH